MRAESSTLFQSFLQGGFECSSHRREDGVRLDLLAATRHDRLAAADYRALRAHGIRTVRDGLRWHLIESAPGVYDWSSFLPMLRAARETGTQVIWDLCHYGWPDDIDVWRPHFVERFARFAAAAARLVREETDAVPIYCPVNEISYLAWTGGDTGRFHPCGIGRGQELKHQLVRAAIAGIEAVRAVEPRARFVQIDPMIRVVASPDRPEDRAVAEGHRQAQFEAWDMICGAAWPGLGGRPDLLDIVGVNYYPDNQWFHDGATIPARFPDYQPLRELLAEMHARYGRPVLIAETGAEGAGRVPWMRYVTDEVAAALTNGVPMIGVCLYPVTDYPGWVDGRHCPVGLLGMPDGSGRRSVHRPLADELRRMNAILPNGSPRSAVA